MTRLSASSTTTPQTFTVVIEGMVVASAGSTIINSAAVNANVKNIGYTERDEVQTIINAGRDLTISKADAPDPVCARSWPDGGNTDDCRGGLQRHVRRRQQWRPGGDERRRPRPASARDDLRRRGTTSRTGTTRATRSGLGHRHLHDPDPRPRASETIEIVLVAPPTLGTDHEHRDRRPEQRDLRGRRDEQHRRSHDDRRHRHRPDDRQGRLAAGLAERVRSDRDERYRRPTGSSSTTPAPRTRPASTSATSCRPGPSS